MPHAEHIDDALLRRFPLPVADGGSKDERGRIFVVAGAPQMPGAAILCATAALRAGAGKLQVATCASVAPHVAAAVLEALVVALPETPSGAIALQAADEIVARANKFDACVIGPGLVDSSACAEVLRAVTPRLDVPTVLDAEALACGGVDARALAHLGGRAILTPHAGEMASALSVERDEIEGDAPRYAREAAQRFNAVVALKGEDTYVATPDGVLFCNTSGHIGLATSGSGDVLAGVIGGLLARGASPLTATLWGVSLHARAGAALGERIGMGFLARELLADIPPLMRALSAPGDA